MKHLNYISTYDLEQLYIAYKRGAMTKAEIFKVIEDKKKFSEDFEQFVKEMVAEHGKHNGE